MTDDLTTRLGEALGGTYHIERELGEGGMATVYLAADLKHERKVAVKVLKPELAAVVGAERFLAEIKTTANLQHPNILPLHDSGEADGFLYYVMPYIEGESLRDRLEREGQLPVDEAVRIARECAEALEAAHEQGVIHRDVKPANILLSRGRPLVSDFGIALAVSAAGGGRLTETGLSMGTPFYMSPEQATADKVPTAASDVYSLGCVLYEMLVGDPPFTASSAQAVLAKILTADAPAPSASRASVPPHVDGAIRKAIERLPADRFQGAGDFARALADTGFRYGAAGDAGRASSTVSSAPPRGPLVRIMAGVIVLLAAALGWALLQRGSGAGRDDGVERYDLTSSLGEIGGLGATALDLSADGRRLIFVSALEAAPRSLWVRSLDDLEPWPIPGTDGAASPALSPDGRVVAFVADRSVRTVTLPDGPPLTIGSGLDPAWGDDGALYFGRNQIIYRVPPEGGEPEPFTESVGFDQMAPDPLPDGRGLVLTVRRSTAPSSRIGVVGPGGGSVREILDGTMARYLTSGHLLYSTADGTLLAAPFDVAALEAGPPVPVASNVSVEGSSHTQFAVSASGSLVYRTAPLVPDDELVWVDREGAVEPIDSTWVGSMAFPSLSPDGTRVALLFDGDVWVKDVRGRAPIRLSFGTQGPVHPAWTPDGDSVLLNEDELLTRAADGGGQPVETHRDPRGVIAPQWSPAGEWLVYRTSINMEGAGDILAVRPGRDSVAIPLLAADEAEIGPTVSPDGRWLAYSVMAPQGETAVYVVPFPNVTDGRWLVSEGGGGNPIWSRDGSELYYVRSGELVAVRVRVDPTFQVLSSRVLFRGAFVDPGLDASYDVAPDGRFLMMRRVGEVGDSRVILVRNLFSLLEELAGGRE